MQYFTFSSHTPPQDTKVSECIVFNVHRKNLLKSCSYFYFYLLKKLSYSKEACELAVKFCNDWSVTANTNITVAMIGKDWNRRDVDRLIFRGEKDLSEIKWNILRCLLSWHIKLHYNKDTKACIK